MNVTNFPMVNPDIVTGVSLMLLFVAAARLHGQRFAGHGVADPRRTSRSACRM
jgi:spermidine/putrescine transport system permease protein